MQVRAGESGFAESTAKRVTMRCHHMTVVEQLRAGTQIFTVGLRNARTSDIVRMAKDAGYGLIWIDLEHSSMPIDCAVQLAATALDLQLEAWVRVPEREYGVIGRLLDGGADGIIVPRVETAAEAQDIVDACRFPPRGRRSQIARLPHFGFAKPPPIELNTGIDRRTTIQILLETQRGIDNADAIAGVDGVDILGVGANDLSADLGCLGEMAHESMRVACRRVAGAASRHGKVAVVGGVADGTHYQSLLNDGFSPLVFAAIDTDLLAAGLAQAASGWGTRLREARDVAARLPAKTESET
jgi:4-hydroxy-2-oxoheptanedioate aldolase